MTKFVTLALALVLVSSCKQEPKVAVDQSEAPKEFSLGELPPVVKLNPKAAEEAKDWTEYHALETAFAALPKVKDKEGLGTFVEDMIDKQKLLAASTYPAIFDIPQIKGRQNVIRTYVLKIKGNLHYDLDVEEPVQELATAYNDFQNQFNVTVNIQLDSLLIEDRATP